MSEPVGLVSDRPEYIGEPGLTKTRIVVIFLLGIITFFAVYAILEQQYISHLVYQHLYPTYDLDKISKIRDLIGDLFIMLILFSAIAVTYVSTWVKPVHESARKWFEGYFNRFMIVALLAGFAVLFAFDLCVIFMGKKNVTYFSYRLFLTVFLSTWISYYNRKLHMDNKWSRWMGR